VVSAGASAAGERDRRGDAGLRPVAGMTKAKIGIADQRADVFADSRFEDLELKFARRSIGWDALQHPWQVDDVDRWLGGARAKGIEPLITFARSRVAVRRTPPTVTEFTAAFRAFRARYPWVRAYATWNEANHCGEGTCRTPQLVARYYAAIRANCPGCTVLAADLLDQPNMLPWARRFTRTAGHEPRYWGLHNYVSANRLDLACTRQLLRATRGEVWLTEVGGLVARRNDSEIVLPEGKAHASRVTRFIFERMARLSPRITRVYLHHWRSQSTGDTWDSAFVGPDGRSRPALSVLENFLVDRGDIA